MHACVLSSRPQVQGGGKQALQSAGTSTVTLGDSTSLGGCSLGRPSAWRAWQARRGVMARRHGGRARRGARGGQPGWGGAARADGYNDGGEQRGARPAGGGPGGKEGRAMEGAAGGGGGGAQGGGVGAWRAAGAVSAAGAPG